MNIGFIYNLYHKDSLADPDFYLEIDADGRDTIDSMISYFKKKHKIYPIEANDRAYGKLKKTKINLT